MAELNVVKEWDENDPTTHGTIWKNNCTEQYYMLAQVDAGMYTLINLQDGNRWKNPVPDKEEAFTDDVGVNNFVRFTGTIELSQDV